MCSWKFDESMFCSLYPISPSLSPPQIFFHLLPSVNFLFPLTSFLSSFLTKKSHVHSTQFQKTWNIYPYQSCHRAELCIAQNAFYKATVAANICLEEDNMSMCFLWGHAPSLCYLQHEIQHSAMKVLHSVWRERETEMSFILYHYRKRFHNGAEQKTLSQRLWIVVFMAMFICSYIVE